MQEIQGLDLSKLNETATKAFNKIAEGRIIDYIRGLMVQAHNQSMKVARLRHEAEQAEAARLKIMEQVERVQSGDWTAIDPLELQDKGGQDKGGQQQDKQ